MAKEVQLRRHASPTTGTYTGPEGEATGDITDKTLRYHDGFTAGGFPLARADLNNVADATNSTPGRMSAAQVTTLEAVDTLSGTNESELDAHVANVSNPHSVTKAQVGLTNVADALQAVAASNLSDLGDAGTARSNLGLGDAATKTVGTSAGTLVLWENIPTGPIPAGTKMIFQQASAPTGWTKVTDAALDNSALRVVTGTPGAGGGADTFASVFGAGKATAGHGLIEAELAAHTHGGGSLAADSDGNHAHNVRIGASSSGTAVLDSATVSDTGNGSFSAPAVVTSGGDHTHTISGTSASAGSGNAHTHNLTMDLKYTDVLVASKDA